VRRLQNAAHSVLVLTGDVHYRRYAWASTLVGTDLVELISSPLTLIDDAVGRKWKDAPSRFPSKSPGTSIRVDTYRKWQGAEDHFLILQCFAKGSAVEFRVYDFGWPPRDAQPGAARPVVEFRLR
jgi:hypothetical protein